MLANFISTSTPELQSWTIRQLVNIRWIGTKRHPTIFRIPDFKFRKSQIWSALLRSLKSRDERFITFNIQRKPQLAMCRWRWQVEETNHLQYIPVNGYYSTCSLYCGIWIALTKPSIPGLTYNPILRHDHIWILL